MNDREVTTPARAADEIDLWHYGWLLWRKWYVIAGVTVLTGGVMYTLGSLEPKMYVGAVTVMVPGATPANHLVNQYSTLLNNTGLATRVVEEFDLQAPPLNLSPALFLRNALGVDPAGPFTNFVVVSVELPDRGLVAKVANRYQELAGELVNRVGQAQNSSTSDLLRAQLAEARARFEETDAAYRKYRQAAQVELTRRDVTALLDQRGGLVALTVEIETERARLAEAERQLATQERSLPAPTALDVSGSLAAGGGAVDGMRLRADAISPYLNPVYEILAQQVTTGRTRIAALERQRSELVGVLKLDQSELAKLTQLYAKESQLARLQMDADLSQKIFTDLASEYERARAKVTGPVIQVHVVDPATTPESSITPGPLRQTQLGLSVGLLIGVAGVLLYESARSRRA